MLTILSFFQAIVRMIVTHSVGENWWDWTVFSLFLSSWWICVMWSIVIVCYMRRELYISEHSEYIICFIFCCISTLCFLYFFFRFLRLNRLPLNKMFFIEIFYFFLIFYIEFFELFLFSHEYIEKTINLLICHRWQNIEPILFFIIVNWFTSENEFYKFSILELYFIKYCKSEVITSDLSHIYKRKSITSDYTKLSLFHKWIFSRLFPFSWFSVSFLYDCAMQKIVLFLLRLISHAIIIRHKPYIVGITGTVGKTTITGHISSIFSREYGTENVGYSPYHYNGEYWLPLSIIGVKSPGSNPFLWIWVFMVWIWKIFSPYQKYLILEYGIDHPGEMDFLLSIAHPDVAIITEIFPNHIEQFHTLEAYRAEKLKIIPYAKTLILHDSLRPFVDREATYYGLGAMSDVDASHIHIDKKWTNATIHAFWKDLPIFIPAFGSFHIENILPLYVLASLLDISFLEIEKYAAKYTPESGRSSILEGVQWSVIIDGSYNGWFLSLRAGITSMRSFLPEHRIVLFLGDMRELGSESERMHRDLAEEIITLFPHDAHIFCFLVWPLMQEYVAPTVSKYFPTETSLSSRNLGSAIRTLIDTNKAIPTMIYVKWSQNTIFLEEGIKFFLANPDDSRLLCRQSGEWMLKKEDFFQKL